MRYLLVFVAVLALASLGLFAWIGATNAEAFIARGPWGDFFGGVANPILTFLTFICVLGTLYLQHQELGLSRKELARSADALEDQIESTSEQKKQNVFFQMLSLHNQMLETIDLYSTESRTVTARGRDCFSTFYDRLSSYYQTATGREKLEGQDAINAAYDFFWEKHQQELGHYFRFLYRMVLFTAKEFPDDDYYMGILRAQLSDQELLLLFYNALSEQGAEFKSLIERWALFDNLPSKRLLSSKEDHKSFFADSAYSTESAQQLRLEEPET